MKKLLLLATLASAFFLPNAYSASKSAEQVDAVYKCQWIDGYYRKDGTWVSGHWRGCN